MIIFHIVLLVTVINENLRHKERHSNIEFYI